MPVDSVSRILNRPRPDHRDARNWACHLTESHWEPERKPHEADERSMPWPQAVNLGRAYLELYCQLRTKEKPL